MGGASPSEALQQGQDVNPTGQEEQPANFGGRMRASGGY
jgi:hypothetical protein